MSLPIILASLICILPIFIFLLGSWVIAVAGRVVGWYLRRKTAGRRAQILECVEAEEKSLAADLDSGRDSDEDWETVESYAAGTAKNGEKADKEWDGIVGFFHPFWYAFFGTAC